MKQSLAWISAALVAFTVVLGLSAQTSPPQRNKDGSSNSVTEGAVTSARLAAGRAEGALRAHDKLPTEVAKMSRRERDRWFVDHKRLLEAAYEARVKQWSLIADQLGEIQKSLQDTAGDRAREAELVRVIDSASKDRQEQRRQLAERLDTASATEKASLQSEIKTLDELIAVDQSIVANATGPGEALRVAAMFGNASRSARAFSQSQADTLEDQLILLTKVRAAVEAVPAVTRPRPYDQPLPDGRVGVDYTGQELLFDVEPGDRVTALPPPGMQVDEKGVLTGKPVQAGEFNVGVRIDSRGLGGDYLLRIIPARVRIGDTFALQAGVQDQDYSQPLVAVDGQQPYEWTSTALPDGLRIQDGRIIGRPTTYVDANVTLTVTDGLKESANKTLRLSIAPPQLVISAVTLPPARQSRPIADTTFTATGGVPPYRWSSTGLAAGLTLDRDGKLTGTPRASNPQHEFSALVRDSRGTESNATLRLPIGAPPPQVTTPNPLPVAQVGIPYSYQLTASGGAGSYNWFFDSKPGWASLSAQGLVTGVPDTDSADVIKVYVQDGAGELSDHVVLGLTTRLNLKITTSLALPRGEVGVKYLDLALQATVPNLKWTKTGVLPKGMTLSEAGVLSGTPQEKGDFAFSVRAALPGPNPLMATQTVNLWIAAPTETWRGDTPDSLVDLVVRDLDQNKWHAVMTVTRKDSNQTKSYEQDGSYEKGRFTLGDKQVFFELTPVKPLAGVKILNIGSDDKMLSSLFAGVNARVKPVK